MIRECDQELHSRLESMAEVGVRSAARGLSEMTGQVMRATTPQVSLIPFRSIQTLVSGPEDETVGVYLRAEGEIAGQFMFIIPVRQARELVDRIMELPPGTTTGIERMERSALAEMGNLVSAFFLNAVAASTGLKAVPTPPAAAVDMAAALLDTLLVNVDELIENVLLIQTGFGPAGSESQVTFWLLPDHCALKALSVHSRPLKTSHSTVPAKNIPAGVQPVQDWQYLIESKSLIE